MKHWGLYRLALDLLPADGRVRESTFPPALTRQIQYILRRHRCVGATVCAFTPAGVQYALSFGMARRDCPASLQTVYRTASVSKFVTALGLLKLAEQGRLCLDRDVNAYLPFPLRHPKAPNTPITLRMLMTHTAGIRDGDAYNAGVARGERLSVILQGDSFADHLPGTVWEYSNLGAGIAGAVMEGAAHADFEMLMQETVFAPLGVQVTYYPQNIRGEAADAFRILPPRRQPTLDARARQRKPLPPAEVNAELHYALAHGNLWTDGENLARLGIAAMEPGFLTEESLNAMRRMAVPFGSRAKNLSQGLFTFILQEPKISPRPLYGHQGMAYGAVHGLFFDPVLQRGVILLTSGASEGRRGVLADINFDLLQLLLGDQSPWTK